MDRERRIFEEYIKMQVNKQFNDTLDKIKAEIEQIDCLPIEDGSDGYDYYVNRYDVLQIVDNIR